MRQRSTRTCHSASNGFSDPFQHPFHRLLFALPPFRRLPLVGPLVPSNCPGRTTSARLAGRAAGNCIIPSFQVGPHAMDPALMGNHTHPDPAWFPQNWHSPCADFPRGPSPFPAPSHSHFAIPAPSAYIYLHPPGDPPDPTTRLYFSPGSRLRGRARSILARHAHRHPANHYRPQRRRPLWPLEVPSRRLAPRSRHPRSALGHAGLRRCFVGDG